MLKLKILTFSGWYLPGYKGGGPTRTLANMVEKMGDEFEFKIVTSDRDSQDKKPYHGIMINEWNDVGKAKVFYMSPSKRSLQDFRNVFCSTDYDFLYLNSFFSPGFTIMPLLLRWLRLVSNKPLVIAPRGEFSPGSLSLKRFKKRVYIGLVKLIGLYGNAVWQASSEYDEINIRRWLGKKIPIVIAPDLPPSVYATDELLTKGNKTKGALNVLFLSRISPEKNLYSALEIISGLKGKIQFDIYGPIGDKIYWAECQKIINTLPKNIEVQYCGSIIHEKVGTVMGKHDVFFLPTKGENFGHVILEAFCAGCPVLISDQTPWRDLEKKGVGWDLPLNKKKLFLDVLQVCVEMNNTEYMNWSKRAQEYGVQVIKDDRTVEKNRRLFNDKFN